VDAGDEHLLKNCRRSCDYMRLFGKAIKQRWPVLDAVVGYAQQADMRSRTDEALPADPDESRCSYGQRDDERSHARGHSDNRNAGDNTDKACRRLARR